MSGERTVMPPLVAICGDRDSPTIKAVPLRSGVQKDVIRVFDEQRSELLSKDQISFDENWINEENQVMVASIPENVTVFSEISNLRTSSMNSIDPSDLSEIRGLAICSSYSGTLCVAVQAFVKSQSLDRNRWPPAISFDRSGMYTRIDNSAFGIANSLACVVEGGLVKFSSLRNLGMVIDTSIMVSSATDAEVRSFASNYSNLFDVDPGNFLELASRNTRRCITSLAKSGSLQGHTAASLKSAANGTKQVININNGKIVMPAKSGEITELMRFLNDNKYVGPVSQKPYVTNSRRLAP